MWMEGRWEGVHEIAFVPVMAQERLVMTCELGLFCLQRLVTIITMA